MTTSDPALRCPCIHFEPAEQAEEMCEVCGHMEDEHGSGFDRSCQVEEG